MDKAPAMTDKLNIIEKMEKATECPICLERLTPPVKLCKNQDVAICKKCSTSIDHCPACGEEFYPRKNIYVDNLLDVMPVSCKNIKNGCGETSSKEGIVEHEKICDYRIISCCNDSCKDKIIYHKLYQHLNSTHGQACLDFQLGVSRNINFDDLNVADLPLSNWWWSFKEINSGKLFLLQYISDFEKKVVYICVSYLSKQKNASKYIYEISFDQGQSVNFSVGNYCTPYLESIEDMEKDSNVLSFDMNKIFSKQDKPLSSIKGKFRVLKNQFFVKV